MSEKPINNTVRVTPEDIQTRQGKTDWERLRNMTEEEIHANALMDEDAQPTDFDYWKDAEVVHPQKSASLGDEGG